MEFVLHDQTMEIAFLMITDVIQKFWKFRVKNR
jgi:hypothetical protein